MTVPHPPSGPLRVPTDRPLAEIYPALLRIETLAAVLDREAPSELEGPGVP